MTSRPAKASECNAADGPGTSSLMRSMSVGFCSMFIPAVRDLRKLSLFFLSLLFVFLSSVSVAVSCWITCSACTHNTLMEVVDDRREAAAL